MSFRLAVMPMYREQGVVLRTWRLGETDRIDERRFRRHLYAPDMPDPDLVIRTSGESRISNFLLWEAAYAELYFTDVLWPDFRREHLFEAVREYQRRDRRFGGVEQ